MVHTSPSPTIYIYADINYFISHLLFLKSKYKIIPKYIFFLYLNKIYKFFFNKIKFNG